MEKAKLSKAIDELVCEVYTPDQKNIDELFVKFLEALEAYMSIGELIDEDINSKLIALQHAYMKKDYITMCDILLYNIKETNLM